MKLVEIFQRNETVGLTAQQVYDKWLATPAGDKAIDEVREIYPKYQSKQLDDAADWLMDKLRDFAESQQIDFDRIEDELAEMVMSGLI